MACYYCGKLGDFECDAIDINGVCMREVCEEHSVPEFEDGKRSDFTLCKHHAHLQHKRGESLPEYFCRIEREAKEAK